MTQSIVTIPYCDFIVQRHLNSHFKKSLVKDQLAILDVIARAMHISQQPETSFILSMWLLFITNVNEADGTTWKMAFLV